MIHGIDDQFNGWRGGKTTSTWSHRFSHRSGWVVWTDEPVWMCEWGRYLIQTESKHGIVITRWHQPWYLKEFRGEWVWREGISHLSQFEHLDCTFTNPLNFREIFVNILRDIRDIRDIAVPSVDRMESEWNPREILNTCSREKGNSITTRKEK